MEVKETERREELGCRMGRPPPGRYHHAGKIEDKSISGESLAMHRADQTGRATRCHVRVRGEHLMRPLCPACH